MKLQLSARDCFVDVHLVAPFRPSSAPERLRTYEYAEASAGGRRQRLIDD